MAKKKKKSDEDEDEKKKGGLLSPKKIVIAAVVGAVLYTQVLSGGGGEAEAGPTTLPEPEQGLIIDVAEDVRVSLADDDEPHFAVIRMAVVLEEMADELEVTNRLPLLRSAAVQEAVTFSASQLKADRGLERLADVLTARADEIFNTPEEMPQVLRVEITELLVQ